MPHWHQIQVRLPDFVRARIRSNTQNLAAFGSAGGIHCSRSISAFGVPCYQTAAMEAVPITSLKTPPNEAPGAAAMTLLGAWLR